VDGGDGSLRNRLSDDVSVRLLFEGSAAYSDEEELVLGDDRRILVHGLTYSADGITAASTSTLYG
jgi:hypothetical protein